MNIRQIRYNLKKFFEKYGKMIIEYIPIIHSIKETFQPNDPIIYRLIHHLITHHWITSTQGITLTTNVIVTVTRALH